MDKEKVKAWLNRALWTFLQAFLAVLIAKVPEGSSFTNVSWIDILEVAIVAGVLSVAKSVLVGVPEGSTDGTLSIDINNPKLWQFNFSSDPDTFSGKNSITLKIDKTDLSSSEEKAE